MTNASLRARCQSTYRRWHCASFVCCLDIRVPARRITEIVQGKRRITPDTALRLARYFNNSPQFWLGLQMDYDLEVAEDELAEQIVHDVRVLPASPPALSRHG